MFIKSINLYAYLLIMCCSAAIIQYTCAQVAFPEQSAVFDKSKANANGRVPLVVGKLCGVNELYYPGDQENDWICDCAPGAVYHPDTEQCYPVYRRGPCVDNEVLVLAPNKIEPECVVNSCKDGEVPISGECIRLGTQGPCKTTPFFNVLGVNPKTMQLGCVELSFDMRIGVANASDYDADKIDLCAVGSKRYIKNRCPQKVQTTSGTQST